MVLKAVRNLVKPTPIAKRNQTKDLSINSLNPQIENPNQFPTLSMVVKESTYFKYNLIFK